MFRFNIHIVVLLFLIFCSNSYGQNRIKGLVQDAETKEKIVGATVILSGTTKGVLSDSSGHFLLEGSEGATLFISCSGYENLKVIYQGNASIAVFNLVPLYREQMQVTILGSRAGKRILLNSPVPIDIISKKELENTGQIDLAQMLQFTSPSFVSVKTGLNGIANYADPASLKGMSPDQSLVLINNKRRHQFAAISNTLLPGRGAVITDLNAIPALALEKIEIMRDGAAAQYGSDAIAGIINLNLNKSDHGGEIRTEFGTTTKGDGVSLLTSINKGWKLKKDGFLNFTFSLQSVSGTNRSDPYTGTFYSNNKYVDDSIRNLRGVWPAGVPAYVMKYGSNQTQAAQSFLNFAYPLKKNWKWYGFGGTSKKYIVAYGFFRTAKPADPNSSAIYPDGYTPLLPGKTADYSFITGFEHSTSNGWKMDLSSGYGYSHLDLYSTKSCNPSLGLESPINFYVGRNTFGQNTTEANFSKTLKGFSLFKMLNIAIGSQLRFDMYKMKEGDSSSYEVGPLALLQGKSSGSSGRPGIAVSDRTNRSRINWGSYVDIEADFKKNWVFAFAGRYEYYNDFGGNLTGKLAMLYKLNDDIGVRGSINRGFRAPSLQQIYNSQTTSNAQNGIIKQTKQLPVNDPRLSEIGIPPPKPELSWNYNAGITIKIVRFLLMTIDVYRVDVSDRIIISEVLPVSSAIPTLLNVFPASSGIKEIAFFTNHIDTRTQGADIFSTWKHQFSKNRKLQASIAWTLNKTTITDYKETPDKLILGSTVPIKLIDTISESLITSAQPHQKLIGSINFQLGNFQILIRASYFGKVIAWEKPQGSYHRSQTFSAKTITDFTAGYSFLKNWRIHAGINNIFNVYPDRVNKEYASYTSGQVPYSRSAIQFGFNGTYMYTTLTYQF